MGLPDTSILFVLFLTWLALAIDRWIYARTESVWIMNSNNKTGNGKWEVEPFKTLATIYSCMVSCILLFVGLFSIFPVVPWSEQTCDHLLWIAVPVNAHFPLVIYCLQGHIVNAVWYPLWRYVLKRWQLSLLRAGKERKREGQCPVKKACQKSGVLQRSIILP